jgi:hypothetical protein
VLLSTLSRLAVVMMVASAGLVIPVTRVLASPAASATGSLVVRKTITGPAAGSQGQLTIYAVCNGTTLAPNIVLGARTAAGTYSHTYTGIPAGAVCTVTETVDGHTTTVTATVTGNGQQVTVPAGGTVTVDVTDTYDQAPGSLVVSKLISGPAAGSQGPVTIHTICGGTALVPDFIIPGGSPANSYSRAYTGIPAGSSCVVSETADGHTSTVSVTVTGSGQQVTVPGGGTATAGLADTYHQIPGSLVVRKTVVGPAAGSQGPVTVHTVCDGTAMTPDLIVPGGSAAGTYSQAYNGLPAGSTCTVSETADGHTSTVTVTITGSGQQVTVPAGGTATASLTDTYDQIPGSLVVSKLISGPAAGSQGPVTIHTVCDGTALVPDLTVPAGAVAGSYSSTYTGLPAGSSCTVSETADGSTSTVSVTVTGSGQVVTVPGGTTATASLTDTYDEVPGSLVVRKTITGPAAGGQGTVTIHTVCDGTALVPDLTVSAGSVAGTYPYTYSGLPAGSSCTVSETADGHTSSVTVTITGSGQQVTIPAGGTATASLTDSYGLAPGSLVVSKLISGPAAGSQGPVTIHTVCDGTALVPDFTIPAGAAAGSYSSTYSAVPGGASCTVTETADGSTSTVTVAVTGSGQLVTVPPGGTATADLGDSYGLALGSLVVSKLISGPAAGSQGAVTIHAVCDGTALVPDFSIPGGSAAGTYSHTYTGVPGGASCTVIETVDGHTGPVTVAVTGSGQLVTVPPGGTATASLTDTYDQVPGSLVVNKAIAGPAAGSQGPVTIHVVCNGTALSPDFIIPGGARATSYSHTYTGIPGGASCTVTETVDGHTSSVTVTVAGSGLVVTVPANGGATATVGDVYDFVPGSLVVRKTIAGPAAGSQGTVTIHTICDGTVLSPDFTVLAGSAAGTYSQTYTGVPGGSSCTVSETADGHTSTVTVTIAGSGQVVTVPPGGTATASLTDSYDQLPGSLVVSKLITGPAAGSQGPGIIHTVCGGTAMTPDLIVPAGSAAGTYPYTYSGLPAGSSCAVTETVDGHTTTVAVTVTGSGQVVTVPAGGTATADLGDNDTFVPGSLVVSKTITGPAAGSEGPVTIHTVCGGTALTPDFTVPAGTPAGTFSHTYGGLPAGTLCTETETADGHTSTVTVTISRSAREIAVPAGGTATASRTDTYDKLPGSLEVSKLISGPAAGSQGTVTIHTVCDGTPLVPDLVIPHGARADGFSHIYPGIPAGSSCTVTETVDGHTSTVDVTVTGSGQQVTVPAGGTATASLTDTYDKLPGSLVLRKTIAGPAAGSEGPVTIHTVCGGTALSPDFTIPGAAPATRYSRTYTGVPGGSSCTVTETVDGHTSTVTVAITGDGQVVTVPAGGTATASLTDSYAYVPGALVISKTIAGPAAGGEGRATIAMSCTLAGTPSFSGRLVIPAGSPAGTSRHTFHGVPAGSACTVTETADGHTATVTATVIGKGHHVTVGAGDLVPVAVTNLYYHASGSLRVTKVIAGPAAGKQGGIAILVSCGKPAKSRVLRIPTWTRAGTTSQLIHGIPAGSTCTVTELVNGATRWVSVLVKGGRQSVTVPAGGTATVRMTDIYTPVPAVPVTG